MFFLAHILIRFDGNVVVDLRRHGFSQSDWRIISTLQYSDNLTLTELARKNLELWEQMQAATRDAFMGRSGPNEGEQPPDDKQGK